MRVLSSACCAQGRRLATEGGNSKTLKLQSRSGRVVPDFFVARLRDDPTTATVKGSLPVLFFGNFFTASIATIGINPSRQEYLSPLGQELKGNARRFETLSSLGAGARRDLSRLQMLGAVERMCGYFDPGRPKFAWFNALGRVVDGLGFSFANGSAVHLDLVQESTDPVWSELVKARPEEARSLLHRDVEFLCRQIEARPFRLIVCTSKSVLKEVGQVFRIRVSAEGKLERVKWTVGQISTKGRVLGVVGWNVPLARATGLTAEGQRDLGRLLRSQLGKSGIGK